MASNLFDEVVKCSGLSNIFAASTIVRACSRVGVDPQSLTPQTLKKALPSIRSAIALYLPPAEIERRILAIEALTR